MRLGSPLLLGIHLVIHLDPGSKQKDIPTTMLKMMTMLALTTLKTLTLRSR
jgi:hypothetical protein